MAVVGNQDSGSEIGRKKRNSQRNYGRESHENKETRKDFLFNQYITFLLFPILDFSVSEFLALSEIYDTVQHVRVKRFIFIFTLLCHVRERIC